MTMRRDEALVYLLGGALLTLLVVCMAAIFAGCGVSRTTAPDGEGTALAVIASEYEARGLPVRLELVHVEWFDPPCLLEWKVDTDHWTIKETCVRGVAPGCVLLVVRPDGEQPISRSSLAHEVLHCAQYQHEIVDIEHGRPEWAWVPEVRARLAEMGL